MSRVGSRAQRLRTMLERRSDEVLSVLRCYRASNPRLFGSVARGDAGPESDLDILVDLDPEGGNPLLRIAGTSEELTGLLGVRVDVVCDELLREPVSAAAHAEARAL
ncbi:nucleotidyltransferase family protein [Gandjariella thermophila]|uniref:nucleotidyltransferase family protein n=1 Tax=Gandjariella thermophila TaxID=1931992 RepID=UPI001CEF5EFC|nr:nucleotidyltransferase domain-containing protein [Gandjariella thermophila]